jgi:hypothetical protein
LASTDGDQRSWTYPRGHWQLEGVTREAGLEARVQTIVRLPLKAHSVPGLCIIFLTLHDGYCKNVAIVTVSPAARRAIRASPFVAKRTRVEIRTPSGRSNYVSPSRAEELFQAKLISWSDGTHLYATSTSPSTIGDYSNILTRRCQWIPTTSGWAGPTVLQLV